MRTTSKEVVAKLQEHILDNFTDEVKYQLQYGGKITTREGLLVDQLDSMQRSSRSLYQTAIDYVEGGSLLVYYFDVKKFLDDLNINESIAREYSDEKSWKLYCHLIAREMCKIYAKAAK